MKSRTVPWTATVNVPDRAAGGVRHGFLDEFDAKGTPDQVLQEYGKRFALELDDLLRQIEAETLLASADKTERT